MSPVIVGIMAIITETMNMRVMTGVTAMATKGETIEADFLIRCDFLYNLRRSIILLN